MKKIFLEFGVIKRILMALTILTFVAGTGLLCYANPFTDIKDFFGTGTDDGRTYLELSGSGDPFEYVYSQDIEFTPAAQNINSATLIFSHKGNSANNGEAWFITDAGSVFLGTLGISTDSNDWVDQTFDLSSLFGGISGTIWTWTLQLKLYENTTGTDRVWIDKSVVIGDYSPVHLDSTPNVTGDFSSVPEPSTLLLLGSGLVGLVSFRRKLKRA
jgi:hypothetical protein